MRPVTLYVIEGVCSMKEKKERNDTAKWIIVAIAIATIIFNSAILYNDVKHLKRAVTEIKMDVKSINAHLLHKSNNE